MTLSTAIRAIAELSAPFTAASALRVIIAAAGIGQVCGTALFVRNMWSRVRMPGAAVVSGR
jgi:hypothetical protein